MAYNRFDVHFAQVKFEENNRTTERPIIIIKDLGDKVICLKCTTNLDTPVDHCKIQMLPEAGLKEETVVVLKNYIKVSKSSLKPKCGRLDIFDITTIQVKLDERKFKMGMQEKFTLNKSLFTEILDSNLDIYRKVAQQVRDEIVNKYGNFIQGKCIEASDKIITKLNYYGIASTAVEGWVWYDYDDGCTDRPYDEHTWVETEDGYVIDVAADQFNFFVEEEFPKIIISEELPHNFSYDEPDDIDLDDSSWLTEAKKKKPQHQQDPVFKSVKDMKKWVKKRQKGMSPWGSFNTNAGNVEVCNQFFNHVMSGGADGTSGLGVSNGGLSSPANGGSVDAGGASAGGMGESFIQLNEANKHKSKHIQNNSIGDLIWYKLPSGKMPAKEFYDESSDRIQGMFDRYFNALKSNSLNNFKEAGKILDNKEKIFELRVKDSDHWARITYTRLDGDSILLLGFNKDQNKTPQNEIEKFIKYKKDYINNQRGERVNVEQD